MSFNDGNAPGSNLVADDNSDADTQMVTQLFAAAEHELQTRENSFDAFWAAWMHKTLFLDELRARQYLERWVQQHPAPVDAEMQIAITAFEMGYDALADTHIERALTQEPENEEIWLNRAIMRSKRLSFTEAIQFVERTLEIKPGHTVAMELCVSMLMKLECYEEALKKLEAEPIVVAESATLTSLLIQAHRCTRRLGSSLILAETLHIDPLGDTPRPAHIANGLVGLGLYDAAGPWLEQSLIEAPTSIVARYTKTLQLIETRQYAECLAWVSACIAADASNAAEYMFFAAICSFKLQRARQGWDYYECRLRMGRQLVNKPGWVGVPEWDGSYIPGGLVIHYEQGLGDVIQCLRYLPLVRPLAPTVFLLVAPEVLKLLEYCADTEAREQVVPTPADISAQISLFSLPKLLGTPELPTPYLYLRTDVINEVGHWLPDANGRLRVAIAWAGNPEHTNDHNRSMRLAEFAQLAEIPGIDFYSFQFDASVIDAVMPPLGMRFVSPEHGLEHMGHSVALLHHMDMLISVDSVGSHLAGAFGLPAWVLLPYCSDWRWPLADTAEPLYNSLRLFHQPRPGDWASVMSNVHAELLKVLGDHERWRQLPAADQLLWRAQQHARGSWEQEFIDMAVNGAISTTEETQWLLCLPKLAGPELAQILQLAATQLGGSQLAAFTAACMADTDGAALPWLARAAEGKISATRRQWLATRHHQTRDFATAIGHWQQLLADLGDTPELWFQLGRAQNFSGLEAEAKHSFAKTYELSPRHYEAANNLGFLTEKGEDTDTALRLYTAAVLRGRWYYFGWYNLGRLLHKGGALNGARACYERALSIKFDAMCVSHYAATLVLVDPALALDTLHQAVTLETCHTADLALNMGLIALAAGEIAEGRAALELGLQLEPQRKDIHMALAWHLLRHRDCQRGWFHYHRGCKWMPLSTPLWEGQDLSDKHVLIYSDQGIGDVIQFVRLVASVPARQITYESGRNLSRLLDGLPEHVKVVTVGNAQELDELGADFQVSVMDLPYRLGVDLDLNPVATPYLRPPEDAAGHWRQRIAQLAPQGFRIGIAWAGNAKYGNDLRRSTALADWKPLLRLLPRVTFVNLQKDRASNQAYLHPQFQLVNAVVECNDLADTAALIQSLDLVVAVDTGLAHLSGAIAQKTWVLLPSHGTDWRWGTEGETVAWYPTTRLFRQHPGEPWSAVLEHVALALERLLNED